MIQHSVAYQDLVSGGVSRNPTRKNSNRSRGRMPSTSGNKDGTCLCYIKIFGESRELFGGGQGNVSTSRILKFPSRIGLKQLQWNNNSNSFLLQVGQGFTSTKAFGKLQLYLIPKEFRKQFRHA